MEMIDLAKVVSARCPKCGSDNIRGLESLAVKRQAGFLIVKFTCDDCGAVFNRPEFKEVDEIRLRGKVTARVYDAKTMKLLQTVTVKNLVVTVGLQEALDKLFGLDPDAVFSYCAVGSDNTAVTAGDTALGSELARSDFDECSRTGQVVTVDTWFGSSEGNGTWRESGLFNAASNGTMLARALFDPVISKDVTKVVQVEWTITASSS
jgi:predicted RNA-binding Zn-ribbon protein involved in translation (DUF1610 family)